MGEKRSVPFLPNALEVDGFRATYPVRGAAQWTSLGSVVDWLQGRGSQISMSGPIADTITTGSLTYHSYSWPRAESLYRIWAVTLRRGNTTQPCYGTFEAPAGTVIGYWQFSSQDSDGRYYPKRFYYLETISSPSATPAAITAKLDGASGSAGTVALDAISCFELPRVFLDTGGAEGVDISSLVPGQAIYVGNNDGRSVGETFDEAVAAEQIARRSSLFSSYFNTPLTITATTFSGTSNIFFCDPPVLIRHLEDGTNARNAAWTVRAKQNGGGTSQVKVTATSGATSTITISTTAQSWHTPATFAVDTEHISRLATDGGIRDGDRDFLTFEAKVVTGTSVEITGIAVGEPSS